MKTLDKLEKGQYAVIKKVNGEGQRRQHFLDMGVIPEAVVKLVQFAPLGDPMEVKIHGYALTLREADAALIEIEPCNGTPTEEKTATSTDSISPPSPTTTPTRAWARKAYTTTRRTKTRCPKAHS